MGGQGRRAEKYLIRDGKRYENSGTVAERFNLDGGANELLRLRKQGLPCIKEGEFYYYNLEDFIAWHADKDYNKKYGKAGDGQCISS